MSTKHCTTHHHACDCREAKFEALREAAQAVVTSGIQHSKDLVVLAALLEADDAT